MIIRFNLSNGIAINKNLTIEQLHKIEQSKQFKKADKKASKCQKRANNRLDILTNYINFLNNFKGV